MNFSTLDELEVARLELPFSVEDVYVALAELNGDKGPGLDGYTAPFQLFSWDIIKDDIMKMF